MNHGFFPRLRATVLCPLAVLILLVVQTGFSGPYIVPRLLKVGETYELRRDGWGDPPGGSAYVGDVVPKTDPNSGTDGDNRYFQRHNVARAWSTDTGYWFTEGDQYEGEPDPAGEQWVDYVPAFEILGSGRYAITASYRWTATRASYPAVYRVTHAQGATEVLQDQRVGSASVFIVWFPLGEFEMRPGSSVRVEDTGAESITFGNMRFKLVSSTPTLKAERSAGNYVLRWPTKTVGFRLESATLFSSTNSWEPVMEPVEQEGADFKVSIPTEGAARFFRLVTP